VETYQLTPRKLTVIYEIRMFATVFTRARNLSLFCARRIQSTNLDLIPSRPFLPMSTKLSLSFRLPYHHTITWLWTVFGLVNGFTVHFNTKLRRRYFTNHYHTQTSVLSSRSSLSCLITASNNKTFFCSRANVLAGWRPSHTNRLTAVWRLSHNGSCQSVLVSSPIWGPKTRFLLL
jgi:hypothetical protein